MFLSIPKEKNYRLLFSAQIVSLAGTGVTTVALALLAHSLAGGDAGVVLGTALAVKMVVYVFFTPVIAALSATLPRKTVLVLLDLVRAVVVLGFFWVSEVWHIYLLIFLLNVASAAFTPVFQSAIPDLLPKESDYTKALSLSRIAYDLENILSPLLAGILLTVLDFNSLFALDALTFLVSAAFILPAVLPANPAASLPDDIWLKIRFGITSYLKTPRLRFALFLVWLVSLAGAMVIVNTVILVREIFQAGESQVALAFVFTGAGSILGALVLPLLKTTEKREMFIGAGVLTAGLGAGVFIQNLPQLFLVWMVLGFGWALIQTPFGRLLKNHQHSPTGRPTLPLTLP